MQIKVLMYGFGFMGQTHAGNLLKNPRAELVGIVNPTRPIDRLATIKGNLDTVTITADDIKDIPHFRSLEEAQASTKAQAIIIAVPTKLHCQAVLQCLDAGLDVFVEKPFAVSLEQCRAMVKKATATKHLLTVGYVVRCMQEYRFLRETIRSGRLGKLGYMKLSRVTGLPNWGNWTNPDFIKASGGALFDLLSHDIDFARFCLGDPEEMETVCSFGKEPVSLTTTRFQYPEAKVMVEGGFVTPSSYPFQRSFTAFFEHGTLESTVGGKVTEYREGEDAVEHDFTGDNPFYTEIDHFLKALQTGELSEELCLAPDALKTIECVTRISETIKHPLPAEKEI